MASFPHLTLLSSVALALYLFSVPVLVRGIPTPQDESPQDIVEPERTEVNNTENGSLSEAEPGVELEELAKQQGRFWGWFEHNATWNASVPRTPASDQGPKTSLFDWMAVKAGTALFKTGALVYNIADTVTLGAASSLVEKAKDKAIDVAIAAYTSGALDKREVKDFPEDLYAIDEKDVNQRQTLTRKGEGQVMERLSQFHSDPVK